MRGYLWRRCDCGEVPQREPPPISMKRKGFRFSTERKTQMAAKTKAIEVKVDERLAEAISDKAVKAWHATNYSNGRKRVYVTFEEVVSA